MPIKKTDLFDRIYIFRESSGFQYPGIEYITLEFLNKIKSMRLRKYVRLVVEPIQLVYYSIKYRPGIINGYQLVPKAYYTVLAAYLSGARSIVSSVGGIPEITTYFRFQSFFEFLNISVLKCSDIVTTKGSTITKYIVDRGVKLEKVFTFNGAINESTFYDMSRSRDIDLLFVGSLIEVKGPIRFVKIVAKLVSLFPNISVSIVGDGAMRSSVESEIIRLDLTNVFTLHGHQENTVEFFQRAKILVMPSRSEGLATAMIEAMACGCVPVVSAVGCMTEAAHHEKNSLVIQDYQEIDEYVFQIIRLLSDSSFLVKLSTSCSTFAHENYSIQKQALIYKEILEKANYLDES